MTPTAAVLELASIVPNDVLPGPGVSMSYKTTSPSSSAARATCVKGLSVTSCVTCDSSIKPHTQLLVDCRKTMSPSLKLARAQSSQAAARSPCNRFDSDSSIDCHVSSAKLASRTSSGGCASRRVASGSLKSGTAETSRASCGIATHPAVTTRCRISAYHGMNRKLLAGGASIGMRIVSVLILRLPGRE